MSRCQYPFIQSFFFFLSQGQIREHRQNWDLFNDVQEFDVIARIKISTDSRYRNYSANTNNDPVFYVFKTAQERSQYQKGRLLHIQLYPSVDWSPVRDLPPLPVTYE